MPVSPLPRWIAHRGGGRHAPENTLAGIRLAARLGYRAVEFDVMLSGSGTPILMHDETLSRTTNGCGRVADLPDAALFALDAGQGERIPRLDAALLLCRELGLMVNLEIKPATGQDLATASAALQVLSAVWPETLPPVWVSSFSLPAMRLVADMEPTRPRALLFEVVPADWPGVFSEIGALSLHCNAQAVDADLLAKTRAMGVPLRCYTVNSPAQAKTLFAQGVSSVFTDALVEFSAEAGA
ncbi:MAG: glycerophosphodiester phosphodiesterase [Azonexus sp.]|nr:glycerophosphodiester phosphodiesterase [Azonexus sp.]